MIECTKKHRLIAYRAAPAMCISYGPCSAWSAITEFQELLVHIDQGICDGFSEVEEEAPVPHYVKAKVDKIRTNIRSLIDALSSINNTFSITFDEGDVEDMEPWSVDWETWKDFFERVDFDEWDQEEGGA